MDLFNLEVQSPAGETGKPRPSDLLSQTATQQKQRLAQILSREAYRMDFFLKKKCSRFYHSPVFVF